MTTATCFWCWHCLRVTEPTRFWRGDLFRCARCQRGAARVPLDSLRRFSFLNRDGATLEEMLRRSRAGESRRTGSDGYSTSDGARGGSDRARYEERWGGRQTRDEPRPHRGRMTLVEAERLFGVERGAGATAVRVAFRRLAMQHHPDRHHSSEGRARAEAMMARINEAYRCLLAR